MPKTEPSLTLLEYVDEIIKEIKKDAQKRREAFKRRKIKSQ